MKESKAVYVTKRDIRDNLHSWYANNTIVNTIEVNKYKLMNDVGVQYNSKRDTIFYANRNVSNARRYHDHDLRYFNPIPRQIFTHSRSKSFTDIGVGSVKALQKKKVKKIYLPETEDRGVGSSDLTTFITRMQSVQNKNKAAKQYRSAQSYYESKRTSSKCVGGAVEYRPECLVSAKVSPIIHTQSGSTSPKEPGLTNESKESKDVDIGTMRTEKQFVTTDTQFEEPEIKVEPAHEVMKDEVKEILAPKVERIDDMANTPKHSTEAIVAAFEISPPETKSVEAKFAVTLPQNKYERLDPLKGSFSSDSFVQHVHNLEQPSEYSKQRDPMENKMEREYRKMFGSVSREKKTPEKQQIPQKSTSLFRRRFTAIKKSLGKKDSKNEEPKQDSVPSVKDASVSSDPPSLEEISMSSTNGYRTNKKKAQRKTSYKRSYTGKKSSKINPIDSAYNQGVKGMFKLWGKKFNLEDSSDTKEDLTQPSSFEKQNTEDKPNVKGEEPKIVVESVPELNEEEKIYGKGKEKKEGKKFLFFKKKLSKDKTKNQNSTYKNKKGVMTGRCEVKEGLTLRMGGAARAPSPTKSKTPQPSALIKKEKSFSLEPHNDLVKAAWLMKFLSNPIESRNSVKVRWNNRTYTTSSSTVFELMGNIYKDPGTVLKSKSLITTEASSIWSSYRPNVNFDQSIEAWMIPTTILDHKFPIMPKNTCNQNLVSRINSKSEIISNNVEVSILDAKRNSKAFTRNEVVLHSKNFVKLHKPETSAEYIRIDIPKGFFSDTSSDGPQPEHSSDEEVYNIVEYESGNCSPTAKHAERRSKEFNPSDHSKSQTIHVTVSVKSAIYEETKIMETVIKRPALQRDVVIQGSNVYIPKVCDVIGVGIITQMDVREVEKPKLMEYLTEEESGHSFTKPCPSNKAKSYLEEYYRNFEPLEMDMFLWCHSDSHMQCCSDNNSRGSYYGETAKSCPNIFEDYITLSSLMSSWSSDKNKCKVTKTDWGILPKDSLVVSKRRRIFAQKKARWIGDYSNPCLNSSSERNLCKKKAQICPNPCTILESKSGSIIHASLRPCLKLPGYSPPSPQSICPPSPCTNNSLPSSSSPPSPCPKSPSSSKLPTPSSKPPSPLSTCLPCPSPKSPPSSKERSPPPCPKPLPPYPKPPPPCIKPTLGPNPPKPGSKPPSPPSLKPPKPRSKPPSPPSPKPPKPRSKPPSPPSKPPSPRCPKPTSPCTKTPSPPCKFNSIQLNSKRVCTPPRHPTGMKISNADSMILPTPVKYGSPCPCPEASPFPPKTPPLPTKTPPSPPKTPPCPPETPPPLPKTPPCRPETPPFPLKIPPCPPKTPPGLPETPPCPPETPPCPPKTPPCPPKTPTSPPKNPPCPYKAPNRLHQTPSPLKTLSRQPKPPPCPQKTPSCPPPLNCKSPCGSPPKSPRSSCSCCSPPRYPHGIEVSCRSSIPCSPKRRLSKTKTPACNSPDKCPHGVKLTACDKYDCPAVERPRPPDCPPKTSLFISKGKESPTNSCCHAPSHRLMHVSTPPSPLQCACSRTKISVQMQVGDVPSIKSANKSFCDDDSPDVYDDQGDYFAEGCTNFVMKSQSEPQQCPVDYDDDTELTSTYPRSQPNFGVSMNKILRKKTDYKVPNLIRLNSSENVMLKYNHGNLSNHNMFNDPQGNHITVNEIASVERDQKEKVCNATDSVINMIEINFKLRVLHGDKMTEINTENEDPIIIPDKKFQKSNNSNKYFDHDAKEVYILKDDDAAEEINSQNDLNIRIIIKNCKPKEPSKEKKAVDVFAKKISEKFKTVSTGYSVDFKCEHPDDTCFSIHRATIDLTTSDDRSVTSKDKLLLKKSELTVIDSKKTKSDENNLGVKSEVLSGQAISLTKNFASVTKAESISETFPMNSTSQGSRLTKPKSNKLSVHSAINESQYLSRKRVKEVSSNPLQLSSNRSIPKKLSRSDEDYSLVDNKLVTFKVSKKSVEEKLSLSDTDEHDISLDNKTSEEPTSKSLVRTSEDHTDPTDFAKSSDSDTKNCAVLIERVPTEEIEYIDLGKTKKYEKKEMLKAVFDSTKYFKKPKSRNKMQKLKDMLKALLTSDTDSDTDHGYQKFVTDTAKCIWDPKVKHNSDSLNNFFEGGSLLVSQSLTKSPIETYDSLQSHRSAFSEDEEKPQNKTCLCSNFAEKLNLTNIEGGCCCCRSALPQKISAQISCHFMNEKILEDYGYNAPSVECVTNNSKYKSSSSKILSMCCKKSSLIPHSRKTSSIKSHSQEETYLFNLETELPSSKMSNKSYEQEKEFRDSSSGDGDLLQGNSNSAGNEAVPYSQEEMHLFDLKPELLSYKISNKGYEQEIKLKDNSYRNSDEDTDNAENKSVSDKISVEIHENEKKLKEDSSHEGLLLEEVNMQEDEPNSSRFSVESNKSEKAYNRKSCRDNYFQEMEVQRYNSTKSVRINEDENVLFENSVNKTGKPDTTRKKKKHNTKVKNQADVLQMYETKKAVLEIYAEKTVTDDGEHLVAKLPKYVRDTESRLYESYEQIEKSSECKSVYKRNFVMMCIGR